MPERWLVPLEGEDTDLNEALRLFATGPIRVSRAAISPKESAIRLQADELERLNNHHVVFSTSERLHSRVGDPRQMAAEAPDPKLNLSIFRQLGAAVT